MNQDLWTGVDTYASELFIGEDEALKGALRRSVEAGLPQIQVSAAQGKFLQLLAIQGGARRILEVGTLGGYSTIWLARGLAEGGSLVTLEYEPKHAAVATENLRQAGLGSTVEVRVGAASDSLPLLLSEGKGPFDLIFIDADKKGYPEYFLWALKLARKGTLIVADNVVRQGRVLDASSEDANFQGVRRMNALVASEPRVSATLLQTVGNKGYDGLMIATVLS
jgi:predicted O-methyltransferase YrrM